MSWVRGFARYLHAIDPAHEVPPPGLLAVPRRRPAPYLYSPDEVLRVLAKARELHPPLRAATYETLFGLLAATGMRSGEAVALTRRDVALVDGMLTVRHAKFDRMRLVPLHPSTTDALRRYALTRDHLCTEARTDRFFLTDTGRGVERWHADEVFLTITTQLGLRTSTVHPRLHDLRHTFAVRTLIDWHRDATDVHAMLPVLSTYLGHVEPKNTYWYYSDSRVIPMPAPSCADDPRGARQTRSADCHSSG